MESESLYTVSLFVICGIVSLDFSLSPQSIGRDWVVALALCDASSSPTIQTVRVVSSKLSGNVPTFMPTERPGLVDVPGGCQGWLILGVEISRSAMYHVLISATCLTPLVLSMFYLFYWANQSCCSHCRRSDLSLHEGNCKTNPMFSKPIDHIVVDQTWACTEATAKTIQCFQNQSTTLS